MIDFDRTEPICYSTYFILRQFRLIKCNFFIHNTMPYIHPDLILKLGRDFLIGCQDTWQKVHIRLKNGCLTVWANLAVTKLFGLRQDSLCLKIFINSLFSFINIWLTLMGKKYEVRSLRLIIFCCEHVDPTIAILVQRSMWSRVSLLMLAENLSRDHTPAK